MRSKHERFLDVGGAARTGDDHRLSTLLNGGRSIDGSERLSTKRAVQSRDRGDDYARARKVRQQPVRIRRQDEHDGARICQERLRFEQTAVDALEFVCGATGRRLYLKSMKD